AIGGCTRLTTAPAAGAKAHGMVVAGIAAGSIEDGEDPNYTGIHTVDQRDRSGIAKEAVILYYRGGDGSVLSWRYAIQQAVADGADVINLSLGDSANRCDTQDTSTYDE